MDRISNLPDHLITHIVACLPIEEAGRTSVLSSRWRHMWKGIDKIQLHGSEPNLEKFINLVDHILNNCSSTNFKLFDLSCPTSIDIPRLNGWIRKILSFNIDKLIIDYSTISVGFPAFPLPECIFACSTLVTLKLHTCFDIRIPESTVCFPHLKSLEFSVLLPNQTSILHQILSSCPVLEELILDGLLFYGEVQKFDICVPTLKSLMLCLDYKGFEDTTEYVVVIDAPYIEYLYLMDNSLSQYVVKSNLSCLRHADISYEAAYPEGLTTMHINNLLQLFKAISNIELLTLNDPTMDVLESALSYTWPTFPDLMMVELFLDDLSGWTSLPNILRAAPNLKVLILNLEAMNIDLTDRQPCQWTPPERVPICLLEHLQVVGIKSFGGNPDEAETIEYLLKNARVLERVLIGYHPNPLNEEVMEKLWNCPTANEDCSVEVYDHIYYQTNLTDSINQISVWGD